MLLNVKKVEAKTNSIAKMNSFFGIFVLRCIE